MAGKERRARRVVNAGISLLILSAASSGCSSQKPENPDFTTGYWYPVEINGEALKGSAIQLALRDFDQQTFEFSDYRLGIRCDDDGRYDAQRKVYVSLWAAPGLPAGPERITEDIAHQDALRRMTHEGVTIKVDRQTLSVTFSTASGQSARFAYMVPMVVD